MVNIRQEGRRLMPVQIKLSDHGLGFLLVASGVVTGEEILEGIQRRDTSVERVQKYLYGIADYTKIDELQVTSDHVGQIARIDEFTAKINPNVNLAIAASKDIAYGMSRMFEIFADKAAWNINVFRTLEEAQAWVRAETKSRVTGELTLEATEDI